MDEKKTSKVAPLKVRKLRGGVRVKTSIKAGPSRRKDIDHVGLYNFVFEIDGINKP